MLIDNNWKIESDTLNVTLLKRKSLPAKNGTPAHDNWKVQGYYLNVENALHAMVDLRINDTGLTDLKVIVEAIEEVHNLIEKMTKECGVV